MRRSCRPVLIAVLAMLTAALLASALARPPAALAAETVANAAGRYDGLALRDLGGRTASIVQLVAADGAFTPVELWRSRTGAFDVRKATFVAGDVNGDGIGDGIVLYDLGKSRARLLIYISDGTRARQKTAWTSRRGKFARSRARIAVGDVNRDGLDDVIALYARGKSGATLYRFTSTGTKFRQSTGWSARRGYAWSRTQLAVGDATGDSRDDAIVLYRISTTASRLDVFAAGASRFAKATFWRGRYPAGRARLAAGDVDSDGDCDAVCLRSGRLDVFRSRGRAFTKPAKWAGGAPATSRFCVGDVTGDGRSDVVTASGAGTSVTRLSTWVSTGTGFAAQTWWQGGWPVARVRLGVAPSPGLVVSDAAEVLSDSSMRVLRAVEQDGTLTFAGRTAQVSRLAPGDVVLSGADDTFPNGLCREVTGVSTVAGQVVVETAPAALTDIIEDGEIAFGGSVTGDDLPDDGIIDPGVRVKRDLAPPGTLPASLGGGHTEGFGFDLTTGIPLPGESLDTLQIEGSVWLDPDFHCSCEISGFWLESAALTEVVSTETDLTVSLQRDFIDKEVEKPIFKRTLSVITIMVGAVPVVVTPEFEVYVGASGTVTAGVSAGMTLTTETTVGVSYDDGDWDTVTTSTYDLTPHQPQLFGSLELSGYAGAGLAFKFYAVAGPEAKIQPYVTLEAATNADPWWTLKAGLDAKVGFKVEVLSTEILSQDFDLHLFEYVIAQAGSEAGGGGSSAFEEPSIRGKILDAGTGLPARFAWVEVDQGGSALRETHAAADGTYVFSGLSPGQYTVTAGKAGYADNSRAVTVAVGQTTTNQNVSLTKYEFQGIRGRVLSTPGGLPVVEARVTIREEVDEWWWHSALDYDYANMDGTYEFQGVPAGTYRVVATANDHFYDSFVVTIGAGQMLENRDLHLVRYEAQGMHGTVVDDLTKAAVHGATIAIHTGTDAPAGPLLGTVTSAADGTFAATGLEPGPYTLVVEETGYVPSIRTVQIASATITEIGQIGLREPGGESMTAPDNEAWVRWTEGVSSAPSGTFEFWFRPTAWGVMEYGNAIAEISRDYPDWHGEGPHRMPVMRIQYGSAVGEPSDTVFVFQVNENDGTDFGTWHRLVAETPVQLFQWYHVAAVYGPPGMRLFVNGRLEATSDYTGVPEANPGASPGGWFSLGGNDTFPGYQTAMGQYRGLCVADSRRYANADFTPPEWPAGGWDVLVLDDLIGTTNGENGGFIATP
jgi:hypothetical protein